MSKAVYEVTGTLDIHGRRWVFLNDLCPDGAKSVTNDAERVVKKINEEYPDCIIIYRDTEGGWAQLRHHKGEFQGFNIIEIE